MSVCFSRIVFLRNPSSVVDFQLTIFPLSAAFKKPVLSLYVFVCISSHFDAILARVSAWPFSETSSSERVSYAKLAVSFLFGKIYYIEFGLFWCATYSGLPRTVVHSSILESKSSESPITHGAWHLLSCMSVIASNNVFLFSSIHTMFSVLLSVPFQCYMTKLIDAGVAPRVIVA